MNGDGKGDARFRLVADIDRLAEPGDAEWAVHDSSPHPGKEASLIFVCPCGCGVSRCASVSPIDGHPTWQWNGNREKPTLTPSLLCTQGCKWHGFLTDGVFVSC